jgi:hypothetical protein
MLYSHLSGNIALLLKCRVFEHRSQKPSGCRQRIPVTHPYHAYLHLSRKYEKPACESILVL